MRYANLFMLAACLALDSAALAADLEKEKEKYEWVGMDTLGQMDAALILAYSKDDFGGTGRNIAFTDSHVEFVKAADIAKAVEACNARRQALNLAKITVPATNKK
jgi:prepilin-type processing-associated H-X9-DG protein